jgi:hypothetical protein
MVLKAKDAFEENEYKMKMQECGGVKKEINDNDGEVAKLTAHFSQ